MSHNERWTPYDAMIRASLRAEGMSASQIAAILGRSREAVSAWEARNGRQCGEAKPWNPASDPKPAWLQR